MGLFDVSRALHRHCQPELMDQPGLDPKAHKQALRGLARINGWSRSASIFWPAIEKLARAHSGDPIRVLDLACGGGDVTLSLARRAAKQGLSIRFDGCDMSDEAVRVARENAACLGLAVEFFRLDVSQEDLPKGYDVIICSLFLHHQDNEGAVRLLQEIAKAAREIILVNDLERSRRGYLLAHLACRMLSRSPIVRNDGPASVAAAFTGEEALALAERAGLHNATLSRHWPERFLLAWSHP